MVLRKQLGAALVGTIVVSASNFIGVVAIARFLGPSEVGIYATCLVVVDVAFSLINFGFNQAVVRHGGDREVYGAALTGVAAQAVIALFALCGVLALQSATPLKLLPGPAWVAGAVVAFRLLGVTSSLLYAAHEVELNYVRISAIQAASALIANTLGVLVAAMSHDVGAFVVRDLTGALLGLAMFWRFRRRGIRLNTSRAALRKLVAFGGRLWSLNFLETLANRADPLIVLGSLGTTAIGGYYTLRSITDGVAAFLIRPIQTVLFARYSQGVDEGRAKERLRRIAVPYAGLVALAALILWPTAPMLVDLFLGARFREAGHALPFLVIGSASVIWFENVKVLALAKGSVINAVRARVLQLTSLILLSFALIHVFGVTGAAIAFALSNVGMAVLISMLSLRSL